MASSSFVDGMHALMKKSPDVVYKYRTSILHEAAENGNVDEIVSYLENTDISAVNKVDFSGRTPLHVAIRNGHLKVAELLLQKGADQTFMKGEYVGNTALHMVANAQLAALLLEYGGDVNATNEYGITPLHNAVREKSSELINVLIKNSANVNAKSHIGMAPLHSVMCSNKLNLDIVSCLIEAGANVNETDFTERTPLHFYCHGIMTTERLSFLITKGCRLDKHDFKGDFPIHRHISSYLYKEADIMDILRILCPNRDYVDLRNCKGRTPLMLAVSKRSTDLGTSFIKLGADVNLTDSFGRTAMHYVTDRESAESLINLMVLHGADINAEDYWGRSPLLHAIAMGTTHCVRVLMKQGANINQQDKCGISPLHMARYNGMKKIFDELAEKGGNVDLKDETGNTPLNAAATVKYMDIFNRLYIECKSTEAYDRLTTAQFAMMHGPEEVAALIENRPVTRKGFSNVGNTYLTKQEVDAFIRDKSCKRSIEDLSSYYSSILNSPLVGRGLDDAEAKEIQLVIEEQMQRIAMGIGELDDRFKCVVLHAGSSSEGTKTNCPDEFDFMFSLEKFSMHCTYEFEEKDNESYQFNTRDNCDNFEGKQTDNDQINGPFRHCKRGVSASGCVYVCIKDDTESETFRQIIGSSKVSCDTMKGLFSDLVERVVYSRRFPKDHRLIPIEVTGKPSIQYSWSGSKYKHLIIDIDLVPALTLPTWPPTVRRNTALLTDDLSRISCMVVPKWTNKSNKPNKHCWRCSFALVETAIFRKLKKEVRNAYITCKAMKTSGVLPSVDVHDDIKTLCLCFEKEKYPDDNTDYVFMFQSPESLIPSYILKMSFLIILEERATESGETSVYDARITIPDPKREGQGLQHATKADKTYYGPAINMHTATASTEVDEELVKSVIQRSYKYLFKRFVPSVFNKRQNVLSYDFRSGGGIEKAIVLFKLMMDIIDGGGECE